MFVNAISGTTELHIRFNMLTILALVLTLLLLKWELYNFPNTLTTDIPVLNFIKLLLMIQL